jgi:hypothetical protein
MTFYNNNNKRAFADLDRATTTNNDGDNVDSEEEKQPVILAAQKTLKAHEEHMSAMLTQCMHVGVALERAPGLEAFCKVAYANADNNNDAERFFDTALHEVRNTINVVVGGRATGKTTKLRALVHALAGGACFISGDYFRAQLLEDVGIQLLSCRPMVLIVSPHALPVHDQYDAQVALEVPIGSTTDRMTSIDYNGYGASVALCVDSESDVDQLARLGVRLNVLRLGSHQYRKPTMFVQDNMVTFRFRSEPHISRDDMTPLLRAGGLQFAAWRTLHNIGIAHIEKRKCEAQLARATSTTRA